MSEIQPSLMSRETREAPDATARLLEREGAAIRALGAKLAQRGPAVVVTCARGSSDNAAGYFKYLLEIGAGIPVASMGPSVASIYGARLRLPGAVLVTVSQSGRSPDLVALQQAAREAGALTVALVNATDGPVAQQADTVIPLHAGPEQSVAATKSFIASLVAAAALVGAWTGDVALSTALENLPAALEKSLAADWSAALPLLAGAQSLYVLGRGPAFPIAQEAALKSKETSAIHAEPFSTAEVMHGPLRLVGERLPVLAMLPDDAARASSVAVLDRIAATGAPLFTATTQAAPGTNLPAIATGNGFADPIAMITSFYVLIEQACRARGLDPDRPTNLRKVTETL
jgi:glucosamine--fructose-6-phosphate aminotransferase (isomerizing)